MVILEIDPPYLVTLVAGAPGPAADMHAHGGGGPQAGRRGQPVLYCRNSIFNAKFENGSSHCSFFKR